MRAFIAIPVPEEIRRRLVAAAARLAPVADSVAWSRIEQFHLTLAFLGDVAPAIVPHVAAAAERVCAARGAVPCRAYGLGIFGSKRYPRIVWAGVDFTPEMEWLYDDLWAELKKLGYKNDEKSFRPHLTLGRCKEGVRNMPMVRAMEADEDVDFGAWRARGVTLYESRPTPRGALYRALASAGFAGEAGL